MKRKQVVLAVGVALVIALVSSWYYFSSQTPSSNSVQVPQDNTQSSKSQKDQKPPQPTSLRIIASGDMLPHGTVSYRAETDSGYDYTQFFDQIKPAFDSADISVCNQEAPSAGEEFGISGYPVFNAPTQFAKDLHAVGCNVIGLANNHLADKGSSALSKTLSVWESIEPLAVNGANASPEDQTVSYFEKDGVTFAFLAFTDHQNRILGEYQVNQLKNPLVKNLVTEANKKADFVMVATHWGSEVNTNVLDSQEQWAQRLANYGADAIFGSGPHELQRYEKIKTSNNTAHVWYSLGNMLSTQLNADQLIGGFAVLDLEVSPDKSDISVKNVTFAPTYMHYEWSAAEKARQDLFARHNLELYPLHKSDAALKRSQLSITQQEALQRVKKALGNNITITPISEL